MFAPHGRVRSAAAGLVPAALLLALLAGCSRHPDGIRGSGTVEMDEIDVSSMVGGRLTMLRVQEGDSVRAGDTLAVLERAQVAADFEAQAARARSATASYKDLQSGSRPAEVVAARADLEAATANLKLAQSDFERAEKLSEQNVVAQAELDRARSTRDAARAAVNSAREQLRLREQGYRNQQVAAARDAAAAADAQLRGARSQLGELVLTAPVSGVVLLRNFLPGELVAANAPILTLGDPDSLWMRVYIAAPKIGAVRLGAPAQIESRGAPGRQFTGRVVQIRDHAEYTPRAALTEEEQANLVFGVKIVVDRNGGALKAGLPADAWIKSSP